MILLQYISILIISFIGLIGGFILTKIASEEIKPSIKYVQILKPIIIAIIFISVIILNFINIYILIALLIILGIIYWIIIKKNNSIIDYAILPLLLYSSINNQKLLISITGLIFIYGLINGIIISEKGWRKILLFHSHYIIIGIIIFTISLF